MSKKFKLAPTEPDETMIRAGMGVGDDNCLYWKHPQQAYIDMLAVAPQPPALGGEPVAWTYMHKGRESYSEPLPRLVWASKDIDVMRQGLKTGDHVHYVPRPDLYDWQPLFYGHEFAPLQADIERLKELLKAYMNAEAEKGIELVALRSVNDQLQAEIERLKEESFEELYNAAIDERIQLKARLNEAELLLLDAGKEDWSIFVLRAEQFLLAALSKPAGSEQV